MKKVCVQWEQWPVEIPPGDKPVILWDPPMGGYRIFGVRFSRPTKILHIYVGHECVATENAELLRAHPEIELDFLGGEYRLWRPTRVAHYDVPSGVYFQMELGKSEGGEAALVMTPFKRVVASEPVVASEEQTAPKQMRREKHLADCRASLAAPLPRRDDLRGRR